MHLETLTLYSVALCLYGCISLGLLVLYDKNADMRVHVHVCNDCTDLLIEANPLIKKLQLVKAILQWI